MKIKVSEALGAHLRLRYTERAQDAMREAAHYLTQAKAPQALRYVQRAQKIVQGAVRHATSRYREALREASNA